jgi:hypothetical protein
MVPKLRRFLVDMDACEMARGSLYDLTLEEAWNSVKLRPSWKVWFLTTIGGNLPRYCKIEDNCIPCNKIRAAREVAGLPVELTKVDEWPDDPPEVLVAKWGGYETTE